MLRTLLKGIVDYAGLFPPAALDMQSAVSNYAAYLDSADRDLLGRFVVSAARLDEFLSSAEPLGPYQQPWNLSVLVPGPAGDGRAFLEAMATIRDFNQVHAARFLIDSLETKLDDRTAAELVMDSLDSGLQLFWELSLDDDLPDNIQWLSERGERHAGKVRTGSVNPALIPKAADVARFLHECAQRNVAFKATAGLHHPLRNIYSLTYEENAPHAKLFGFLNVFVAAVLARTHRLTSDELIPVLECEQLDKFVFAEDELGWGKWRVSRDQVGLLRKRFAISFGSCSFTEPVDEILATGLLNRGTMTQR